MKLALMLAAVRILFKLLGRMPELFELEEFVTNGTVPEPEPEPGDVAVRAAGEVAGTQFGEKLAGLFSAAPGGEGAPDPANLHSAEPLFTGPIRTLLQRRREAIVEAMVAQGIDRDAARSAVGKIGDGKILSLILKYGPDLFAIAKIIIEMFLK